LPSVVESKLGVPTEIANPFKSIEIDESKFNMTHITEVAPAAAVSMGLALRFVGDK